MRKVQVYRYEESNRIEDGVGFFHQLGIDYEEFRDGIGLFTTAIIERLDGTIKNVAIENIKFLDKPNGFSESMGNSKKRSDKKTS